MSTADVYGVRGYTGTAGTPGSPNPLVVGSIDTTHALSGTRLVEDIYQITEAIENKDWLSGTLAGVATVADIAAAVMDPIGTAIAMGIGWVLDHVEPLKGWMNDLTGDAGAVAGAAATWGNIAAVLEQAGADAQQLLDTYFARQRSAAIQAFWSLQSSYAEHLGAAAGLAGALSTGLTIASTLVQIVHDLVRDAIGDIIGKIASSAILEACTLGLATPWVVSNIATMVAKWTARLSSEVKSLVNSFDKLSTLVRKADDALRSLKTLLSKLGDVPTSVKKAISDSPIGHGAKQFREGVERVSQGGNELMDIAKKWWKPEFSDDIVRQGGPSATERLPEILQDEKLRDFMRLNGVSPWDLDTYLAKRQLFADSPDMSDIDREVLFRVREAFGRIEPGDIVSKVHLQQAESGLPKVFDDIINFVGKSVDTVGLKPPEKFDALGGGYYLGPFDPAAKTAPPRNAYVEGWPMYETRVRADQGFVDDLAIPYSPEMRDVDNFGSRWTTSRLNENWGHADGPFTGHGVTQSEGPTVVPEYKHMPGTGKDRIPASEADSVQAMSAPTEKKRVRYQEIYEIGADGTGRRRAIVVDLPWRRGEPITIPTFR